MTLRFPNLETTMNTIKNRASFATPAATRSVAARPAAIEALECRRLLSVAILSGPVTNPANGYSYYLLAQSDWYDAQAQAQSLGGNLATIRNQADNDWIYSQFANSGAGRSLWIGLQVVPPSSNFAWADGDASAFRDWAPGEPNNSGGVENAVEMYGPETGYSYLNGLWNDLDGSSTADTGNPIFGVVETHQSVVPIATLFGTGIATNNADGSPATLVAQGAGDPHYTITAAPQGATPGPGSVTLVNGYPVGNPWLADDSLSQWISPLANQQTLEPPGIYAYVTTFSLAGLDPRTATISGEVGADDASLAIFLNGTSIAAPPPSFNPLQPFSITSGFVAGINTLEFDVGNGPAGGSSNPTGLRVALSGTDNATAMIGPSSQLAFGQQPSDATVGGTIPAITIDLEDSNGNIVTADNSNVSISVAGATLNGTT